MGAGRSARGPGQREAAPVGGTAPPAARGPLISPEGLTARQRRGEACISCRKAWPRPPVRAGYLPSGEPLYVCEDCAAVIEPAVGAHRAAPVHKGV